MNLRFACLLIVALAGAPRAAAAATAPLDSAAFRPITSAPPYLGLALRGRTAAMDSLARAEWAALLARGTRDSLAIARAIDGLLETGLPAGRGREPGLLALAERALAIHTRWPGPDSLLLSRTLIAKGELHRRRREIDEALRLLDRAVAIRERALPARSPDVAQPRRFRALAYASNANLAALPDARFNYDVTRETWGDDDVRTAIALNIVGAALNLAGDKIGALRALERAQAVVERAFGPDHPEVSRGRNNVGLLAMFVGDYSRARAAFEGAIAANTARSPIDTLQLASAWGTLIECLNDFGDFEGALAASDRQLPLLWRTTTPLDLDFGEAHYQRSRALRELGLTAAAAASYDTAMAVQRHLHPDSAGTAVMAFDAARLARAAGDTASARAEAERAIRLAELQPGGTGPVPAETGLLLGQVLNDCGRPAEALTWLRRAGAWTDSMVGARSPGRAALLLEEARALRLLADPGAFAVALAAADLRTEHLRAGARGFAERQALLNAREGPGLDPLLSLAASGALSGAQRRAAFERLAAGRALVLDEIAARQRLAREASSPVARALLDSLFEARATLARGLVRADAAGDSALRAARREADRFENALAALGLGAAPVPAESPLARLVPGDALVAYAEYDEPLRGARVERRMLAFVARPGADPEVVPLGPVAGVDACVRAWRADVALGLARDADAALAERRARASGERLRALAWDPVAARVRGATRVLLVSEGALHLVDFAALPAGKAGYLVESGPLFARLTAERDLVRAAPAPRDSAALPLLAVGGADFEARPGAGPAAPVADRRGSAIACPEFRSVRFAALPGAAREADEAATLWRAAGRTAVVLSGGAAAEAEFKRAAPRSAALHVATHGFFLGAACTGGGAGTRGIGGLASASPAPAPRVAQQSPLRLAGLAFAGANRRDEAAADADDGILAAEEIASLDLAQVNDVVLSACDSGVGDVETHEGVLGLERAFRIAGARAVVMSLWPVDDEAAREWMRGYWRERLRGGASVPAAARDAARARLADLRARRLPAPPARWAGFVASGDGR